MNMKKSIAGVMAGAMAVSAMATTASAFTGADQEQIVLSYDLNTYYTANTDRTLTVTYTFNDRTDGYVVKGLTDANPEVKGAIGAYLTGPDLYMLTGLKIQGASLPQYDEKGTSHTSTDSWSFSIEQENANAYGSAVNGVVKLPDSAAILDANNNVYAYEVPFTTSTAAAGKVALGGFKIYGAETEENVKFTNEADALDAAKKESVYTLVEEVKAETKTVTWTDTTTGKTYDAKDVTPTAGNKGEVTTQKGSTSIEVYTQANIVPVYTGGDWVLAVDKLDAKGNNLVKADGVPTATTRYINAVISPDVKDTDIIEDASKVTVRYATRPEAVAAIANAHKDAATTTDSYVATLTGDVIEIDETGSTVFFKFNGKYIKAKTKGQEETAADAGSLEAFITALNGAGDATKEFDEVAGAAGVTGLLTDDITEAAFSADIVTAKAAKAEAIKNVPVTAQYKVVNTTTTEAADFKVTVKYTTADTKVEVTKTEKGNNDGIYYLAKPVAGGVDGQGNIVYIAGERKTQVTAKNEGYGFKNFTITLTYAWNGTEKNGTNWASVNVWANATKGYVNELIDATTDAKEATTGWDSVVFAEPLRSAPTKPGNVINRLTVNGYTYPQAVLNDVVANNENVAFTFTTCQKYVDTRDYVNPKAIITKDNKPVAFRLATPAGGSYLVDAKDVKYFVSGDKYWVTNEFRGVAYDAKPGTDFNNNGNWYNPYFTQDLYQQWTWNNLDGNDKMWSVNDIQGDLNNGYHEFGPNGTQTSLDLFGSYASGWNKNLLAAGLVVNSAWTMQLSQTTAFSWGDQSITFLWDDITADKNVTNAANFITSLQLYTPVEWFWDRLDVSVGAAISEDIVPGAGLEEDADEEAVEEEVVEEEVIEEDFVEEEPVEEEPEEDFEEDFEEDWVEEEPVEEDFIEEEPVEEEVVEEEPVEEEAAEEEEKEEESPKTGNSPIALAVIPVALAAAAVIAKKRS